MLIFLAFVIIPLRELNFFRGVVKLENNKTLVCPISDSEKHNIDINPEVGQWYWIKTEISEKYEAIGLPDPEYKWFAMVYSIGSNYVEFKSHSYESRILFDDLAHKVIYEPNHEDIIKMNYDKHTADVQNYLKEINKLTRSLGVSPQRTLDAPQASSALVLSSSNKDAKEFKKDLIIAKNEKLPMLFDCLKKSQKKIQRWLSLEALEMEALVDSMSTIIGSIEKKIFHITLYAGLTEEVVLVKDGQPASVDKQVHVMQRRLYMDEECLINYKHGGIEFCNIDDFDNWLMQKDNFHRCLPYEKCIVTFRVRRSVKERSPAKGIVENLIRIQIEAADKFTYMYIRNGEKLYRMCTDMDFGEQIFPSLTDFDPMEPKMFMVFCTSVQKMISRSLWEQLRDEELEREEKSKQWFKENPFEKWSKENGSESRFFWEHSDPYRGYSSRIDRLDEWERLDKSSVHYDEGIEYLNKKMEEYNRIALIIQGLLDRSDVLSPLPPIDLKNQGELQKRVKLIYDGENTLYFGEMPSIKEYINKCNLSADENSVFIGQSQYWLKKQAEKENERREKYYYDDRSIVLKYYKPPGNPGPSYISKGNKFHPRARKVTFEWMREMQTIDRYRELKRTSVSVPIDKLFNVSAYKPGDYKIFFADPRTRAEYFKWAPFLLAAEEYHAGTWDENDYSCKLQYF